jgi:hypothetical protein
MSTDKQWYIDYFNHMEEEDKKIPLGGMAWDDLSYHADTSIKKGFLLYKNLKKSGPIYGVG